MDLRTLPTSNSYNDPAYGNIEGGLESKYGLPQGIMARIRTKGERSNADQVSEASARSVYQVIPSTRAAFLKKYGVDAYAGPQQAAEVAALHLRDSLRKPGATINDAVGEYIGGPDRSRWGPRTAAYASRAGTGGGSSDAPPATTAPAPEADFSPGNTEDLKDALAKVFQPREAGPHFVHTPKQDAIANRQADTAALTGGKGIIAQTDRDLSEGWQADENTETQTNAANQRTLDGYGTWDRFKAGFQRSSLGYAIYESMDGNHPEADPGWSRKYLSNMDGYEKGAISEAQVHERRAAQSQADYDSIVAKQEADNKRGVVLNSAGSGWGVVHSLAGGIIDPVGLVAGLGVGKAFQLAGVGGRALMAAGRPVAAIASLAGEGALANVAVTAGLDGSGKYVSTEDYAAAAGFGLAIGGLASPLALHGVHPDLSVAEAGRSLSEAAVPHRAALEAKARSVLGEGATPEALQAEVGRQDAANQVERLKVSLADVPEGRKLMGYVEAGAEPGSNEGLHIADPEKLSSTVWKHNLDSISDDGERALVAEHVIRAESLLADSPIRKSATNTALSHIDAQSTGVTLLRSESPVAQAVGSTLLESTMGGAGRYRTAAMSMAVRERLYARYIEGYDTMYHMFRKAEGRGLFAEAWNPKARQAFNKRVFYEIENRRYGRSMEDNQAVLKAADMWERGMTQMRVEQQHVGTTGHARLGDTSVGYMTHRILPGRVLKLAPEQEHAIRGVLSDQFVDPRNTFDVKLRDGEAGPQRGWDREFADKFATKYLEAAKTRALGGFDVPMNLHDPAAADIVMDTAQALHLSPADTAKLLGKFSRGGANHTKGRLDLDLSTPIPDGKGGDMPLGELFNQDIMSLYHGYSRRVAGEVALAQYGVMGKAGMSTLRKAIEATRGSAEDLKAFDQIASEFLNTPFGKNNHKYLDNLRLATSLSRLGGMGFTQFAEYTNSVAALGAQRALESITSFPRLAAEIKAIRAGKEIENGVLKDIDTLGGDVGLEEYKMTRMFDMQDQDVQLYSGEAAGIGTRALKAGGNVNAMLSGHRMVLAVQTRGMAEQIIRKAVAYAKAGTEDVALNDMGFNAELRQAMRDNMDKLATFDGKGRLQDLNLLESGLKPDQIMSIRDAVERGASQIIQKTYVGETGKWAHDGLLKLLYQFRTFSLISVEKQWGRNRVNFGVLKATMYLMGAMSLAVPVHLARLQAKMIGMNSADRDKLVKREMTFAKIARATMNYASASGLAGDIMDLGGGFANGLAGGDVASSVGARGQTQGNLIGGVLAPGVGMLEDGWDGMHGDAHKLVGLLPGANLPYIQPIVNQIGKKHQSH